MTSGSTIRAACARTDTGTARLSSAFAQTSCDGSDSIPISRHRLQPTHYHPSGGVRGRAEPRSASARPVAYHSGDKELQSLTEEDIEALVDWMLTSGRRHGGQPGTRLGVRTVRLSLGRLRAALNLAVRRCLQVSILLRPVPRGRSAHRPFGKANAQSQPDGGQGPARRARAWSMMPCLKASREVVPSSFRSSHSLVQARKERSTAGWLSWSHAS